MFAHVLADARLDCSLFNAFQLHRIARREFFSMDQGPHPYGPLLCLAGINGGLYVRHAEDDGATFTPLGNGGPTKVHAVVHAGAFYNVLGQNPLWIAALYFVVESSFHGSEQNCLSLHGKGLGVESVSPFDGAIKIAQQKVSSWMAAEAAGRKFKKKRGVKL